MSCKGGKGAHIYQGKVAAIDVESDIEHDKIKAITALWGEVMPVSETTAPASPKRYVIPFTGYDNVTPPPPVAPSQCAELPIFRLVANEFRDYPDEYVCQWMALARPWVSRRQYRAHYAQGVAYFTAHMMAMAKKALDESEGLYPLSSISEDGASESYVVQVPSLDTALAALKMTGYGQMYLSMRQSLILV